MANPSFFKKLFSLTHGLTVIRASSASNLNLFSDGVCGIDTTHLQTGRRASGNKGFMKLAVQWLNQVQFSNQTFVQVDSFVLRIRHLRQAPKRSTPLRDYKMNGGVNIMSYGEAVWHYPDGNFVYGKFHLKSTAYHVQE